MRGNRVRRWFAAGITGTLFAIMMLALAAPVAADGGTLVTPLPGQDPNAPIQVVSSPGFVNNGTATNPFTGTTINGQTVAVVNGQPVTFINGQPITFVNGQPVIFINGQPVFVNNGQFFFTNPGVSIPGGVCVGGVCGFTAAGPIVGFDNNGNPIVFDARGGGGFDAYTRGPNGVVCEADSTGNCEKGSPGNP
jgi:hypothetical protein